MLGWLRRLAAAAACATAVAQSTVPAALDPLTDAALWSPWVQNMTAWGVATATAMGYSASDPGSAYANPSLSWVADAVLHVDIALSDRRLGAPAAGGNYTTIAGYLASIEAVLGPVDAVTLWPALPLLGLDGRDQWDWLLNGHGAGAIANAAATFRAAGVVPLLGVVGWDGGTTPSPAAFAPAATLVALGLAGAAGLDVPFFDPAWDTDNATGTAFALCGDGPLPGGPPPPPPAQPPLARTPCSRSAALGALAATGTGAPAPRPSAFRWLEPRHAAAAPLALLGGSGTRRRDAILAAFLGGAGLSVTDNNFGVLRDAASPRDAELLRRTSALVRVVRALVRPGPLQAPQPRPPAGSHALRDPPLPAGLPPDARWLPQLPVTVDGAAGAGSVVASQFFAGCPATGPLRQQRQPQPQHAGSRSSAAWRDALRAGALAPGADNCTLYLLANFGAAPALASVNASLAYAHANASASGPATLTFVDLYHGTVLYNATSNGGAAAPALTLPVLPGDIAAVLVTPHALSPELRDFLAFAAANLSRVNITAFSDGWAAAPQAASPPFAPTPPASSPPLGTVLLPGAAGFLFVVNASVPQPVSRGGPGLPGGDTQYAWEPAPTAAHAFALDVPPFYMYAELVTNDDFQAFMWATGYAPVDSGDFLRHWVVLANGSRAVNGSAGDGPRPVVWVSRTDAAAYCAAYGARLPLEWEWAYAAQAGADGAPDGRAYPWGDAACEAAPAGTCPSTDASRAPRPPDAVGSHPAGNSPLGLADMVGLVWQHTFSAYCDDAACAAILRGGSYYAPSDPSGRYPPRLVDNFHHVRMPYGRDAGTRAATVGFRCVVDTPTSSLHSQ